MSRLYLGHEAGDGDVFARPEVHMHVEGVAGAGEAGVVGSARQAEVGLVDGFTVGVHPVADLGQDPDRLLGDRAVSPGSDIKQIIAAVANAGDEVADDGLRRLPVIVGTLIAPAIVEGHAALPGAAVGLGDDLLFGSGEVSGELVAVVHDDVGLKLEDHLVHALGLPSPGVERPGDVVPEHVDLAVVGEQLADEAVGVFDEALAGLLIGGAASAVGMVPVHERVVEADAQAFGAGGVDILADEIALGSLLGGAVVGELGVEVAEALVVLGRHDHVLHAGGLGEFGPGAREARLGVELFVQRQVLDDRDCLGLHGPLVPAILAIEAEVDEHAELCRVPPLHAANLIGRRGDREGMPLSCGRRRGRRLSVCADGERGKRGAGAQQHIPSAYFERIHSYPVLVCFANDWNGWARASAAPETTLSSSAAFYLSAKTIVKNKNNISYNKHGLSVVL